VLYPGRWYGVFINTKPKGRGGGNKNSKGQEGNRISVLAKSANNKNAITDGEKKVSTSTGRVEGQKKGGLSKKIGNVLTFPVDEKGISQKGERGRVTDGETQTRGSVVTATPLLRRGSLYMGGP